ncbi:MAG: hypothetical protein KOO62_06130 [candidate division Zixibacteria bacterium]|nr:hypothetical protein [candidate division Zixibacteria bacterium]
MRLIPYLVYLLLIACHQVILKDLTDIFGVGLSLTAFLVMAVAISKSELISMWFGFVAGLVMLAGYPDLMGGSAVITAMLGLAAFHACERLNLESLYSKLLLVLAGVVLHNALILLLMNWSEFFHLLIVSALPSAIYTTVLAWIYFLVLEGRLTFRKLRSVF